MKRFVTVLLVIALLGSMVLAALAAGSKEERIEYSKYFELYVLAKGLDSHIRVDGKDATTLRMEWASCTRQEAEQLLKMRDGEWPAAWKKKGFKRVIMTNGHDAWEFNLQK